MSDGQSWREDSVKTCMKEEEMWLVYVFIMENNEREGREDGARGGGATAHMSNFKDIFFPIKLH